MNSQQLATLLSELPPGILCTSDGHDEVNGAVFGSTRLLEDGRLIVGLGHNRTLENLQRNPNACYISYSPGKTVLSCKGIRLYLTLNSLENQGKNYEDTVALIEQNAGKQAAQMTRSVAIFNISSSRPLIDFNP